MSDITIAAISTPPGKGGVALIRISGENALSVAEKAFSPRSGKSLADYRPASAVYGDILYDGEKIDDGMAVFFKTPKSYTGEDTVEISCHGGILISEKALSAVLHAGAVPAPAGEFTKRAFLNGKMLLTQASAVIDTINAESEEQLKLARSHMDGRLTHELDGICASLITLLSQCFVLCDYPDEDLASIPKSEMLETLYGIKNRLLRLSDSYRQGHAVAEGIKTVIIGKPNVGKSSLLNALLGYDRAIVSENAGTTRDTVEENIYIGRIMLRLCDTAGVRQNAEDSVERMGIDRSLEKLKNAELVLAVFDSSEPECDDEILLSTLSKTSAAKIAVFNKSDLSATGCKSALPNGFSASVDTCATENRGIDKLRETIEKLYFEESIDYTSTAVLSSARQKESVKQALDCILRAIEAIESDMPADIAGLDLERAVSLLKETDGRLVSEDIVHGIFSRFCVGK